MTIKRYGLPLKEYFKHVKKVLLLLSLSPDLCWNPLGRGYEYQKKLLFRKERHALFNGANRGGKTLAAAWEDVIVALLPNRHIWIVAAELSLTKFAFIYCVQALSWLQKIAPGFCPRFNILKSEHKIELENGSFIHCKSLKNPPSLEGEELDLIDIEEMSNPQTDINWFVQFMPTRLMSRKGSFISYFTPIQGGEIKCWTEEQFARDDVFSIKKYSAWDYPHIDKEELAKLEKSMPTMYYKERVLGEYAEYIGKVYSEFDYNLNTFGDDYELPEDMYFFGGMDFGEVANSALEIIGYSPSQKKYYVLDEYSISTPRLSEFMYGCIYKLRQRGFNYTEFRLFGDDDAKMPLRELMMEGFNRLQPARKHLYKDYWLESLRRINTMFKRSEIMISRRCEVMLKCLTLYIWNEKTGKPIDKYDDELDAMRYGIFGDLLSAGWSIAELFDSIIYEPVKEKIFKTKDIQKKYITKSIPEEHEIWDDCLILPASFGRKR